VTFRWYVCGLALAAAVGWLAARCHLAGWAPIGIVSLAVGIAIGLGAVKFASLLGVGGRSRLVIGACLFALVTIFAEHAWLYRDFRRQWREVRDANPRVAIFRPETPWTPVEYLQFEATGPRVTLWCIDAVLILAGTIGAAMMRRTTGSSAATRREFVVADDNNLN
jgi:hypothetical protein